MFDWLQAEIETSNAAMGSKGGCVIYRDLKAKLNYMKHQTLIIKGVLKRNVLNIVKEKF